MWVVILIIILILITFIFYCIGKRKLINQNYNNSLFYNNDKISRLIEINRTNHLYNLWPSVLFVSLILSLFIVLCFSNKRSYNDFQLFFDYLIINLIIFVPMFFTITWFQAHWIRERDDLIEKELLRIRNEINR
jgi:hypothetical protein